MRNIFFEWSVASASIGGEDDEEEEDDEMPSDLEHLSPSEQQRRIKRRAAYMLGVGTIVILFFSDPMVSVLDEMGKRLVSKRGSVCTRHANPLFSS